MSTHHKANPKILNRRSLQSDHRILADLLRPGMSVLDVGCGTGAITVGIAKTVGPDARVVGLDLDAELQSIAAQADNLTYLQGDATDFQLPEQFDVVTAARTLQWIAQPERAIASMVQACKPGGMLVVLDYNFFGNTWDPAPPASTLRFYGDFLSWREANGWDNAMGQHLPDLLKAAGLINVQSYAQEEVTRRGDADFPLRSQLWLDAMHTMGNKKVPLAPGAMEEYAAYVDAVMSEQKLSLHTAVGYRPAGA